jgi:hypothetical protein
MQGGSVLNPSSSLAHPISHLFWIVGFVMAVILLLVTTLVLCACIRYRSKKDGGVPPQNYGRSALEITWTVAPFLVLVFIFVATIHAMQASNPTPAPGQEPDLIIIAHQWWWEALYPGANVMAANEIHIPVGKRFYVRLESADVIHDWWVVSCSPFFAPAGLPRIKTGRIAQRNNRRGQQVSGVLQQKAKGSAPGLARGWEFLGSNSKKRKRGERGWEARAQFEASSGPTWKSRHRLFDRATSVEIANRAEYEWHSDKGWDPFAKRNGLV